MLKKMLACGLLVFYMVGYVSAVPGQIGYQGILQDSLGNPLTGSYSIVFAIYDTTSGGSSLWTETQSVSVEAGLYNIQLGSSTALSSSVFDGTTRYLGIKVGSDAEMTPRVALVTVPYAFRASVADTIAGGTTGSYVILGTSETQSTTNKCGIRIKSTNDWGIGVLGIYGQLPILTSFKCGGAFYSYGDNATGVSGVSSCDAGVLHGTGGSFKSYAEDGYGVVGSVYGETAAGVYGRAYNSGDHINYGGFFYTDGGKGMGVFGRAVADTGGPTYGGYFTADGHNSYGVKGKTYGTDSYGVYGDNQSVTTGTGVYGRSYGVTGYGVYGDNQSVTTGTGVYGRSYGVAGYGVYGENMTTDGIAVYVDDILQLEPRSGLPGGTAAGGMCFLEGVGLCVADGTKWYKVSTEEVSP